MNYTCTDNVPCNGEAARSANTCKTETIPMKIEALKKQVYEVKSHVGYIGDYLFGPRPQDTCFDKEPCCMEDELDILRLDLSDILSALVCMCDRIN